MLDFYTYSKRVAMAVFITLLMAGFFYLLLHATHFFLLVFGGILLAVLYSALANWLVSKTNMNRSLALALVILGLFGFLVGAGFLVAPAISEQVEEMKESVPEMWQSLKGWLAQQPWGPRMLEELENNREDLMPDQQAALSRLSGIFSSTLGFITDVGIVLITSFFLALNPSLYLNGFIKLIPVKHRGRSYEIIDKLYVTLQQWLSGMLIAMTMIGVSTWIVLALMGVKLALLLGFMAFFLNAIPNIGPILSGIPVVLVGLLDSPETALKLIIVYTIVQCIEGYIITPLIFERTVALPPAILLFLQVLLGILIGPLGVLMAAPLLAVAMVLTQEIYVKDMLEKDTSQLSFSEQRAQNLGQAKADE
ncbi:AI-2E family transporter [Pontibacter qinzhouensis]|uniref:AI-2E family transporter n=1 Tax=Pontibacter qinzhouensis TaxID=2603253 RepID=A0A5C8JHC7_9BACT|nr:AI-2E family transporter [Pontibacter qinzhouensis]TXK37895.1 AI-2E family transporter [Pontibacter qinzhouensis]